MARNELTGFVIDVGKHMSLAPPGAFESMRNAAVGLIHEKVCVKSTQNNSMCNTANGMKCYITGDSAESAAQPCYCRALRLPAALGPDANARLFRNSL